MNKSIYRKAAEHIANMDIYVNGYRVNYGWGRIFSCQVIDALTSSCDSDERHLYESFMCYDPEYCYDCGDHGAFDTDEQAILALLLFDEILKHKDNE